MANTYGIPGYFDNCVVKNDYVVENKFIGKTIYRYKNNSLIEPGFLGKTILVFRGDGIYSPGFLGEKLFSITKYGEVKEVGLFGRSVGAIPTWWIPSDKPDCSPNAKPLTDDKSYVDEGMHRGFDEAKSQREIDELNEELNLQSGYVADYTNCRPEAKKITIPTKYKTLTAIAPALRNIETVVIHAGILKINQQSIHCSRAYVVDDDNPNFASIDGILYNKDISAVISVPFEKEMAGFRFPGTVRKFLNNAFGYYSFETFLLQKGIEDPGNLSVKKNFEVEEGNLFLKTIDGILYSADGKTLFSAPRRAKLANLLLPEGLERINKDAFNGVKVNKIVLPHGLKTIESQAFIDSTLTQIYIPDSVEFIGDSAFYRIKNLSIECQTADIGKNWAKKWARYDFDMYKPTIVFGVEKPNF